MPEGCPNNAKLSSRETFRLDQFVGGNYSNAAMLKNVSQAVILVVVVVSDAVGAC
jgi:hypothetical protein